MRLLYLPNEHELGEQVAPRAFFGRLQESGRIDLRIFSFLIEEKSLGRVESTRKLLELAEEFQPDVIFWQHIGRYAISSRELERLRLLRSRPTIAYHEGDVYGGLVKRPTPAMRRIARVSDISFVVGGGSYAKAFEQWGSRRVSYVPNVYDTTRFGVVPIPPPSNEREFDVMMIANRQRHSSAMLGYVGFLSMPGEKSRVELALRLGRRFGKRFGLFGAGWEAFSGNRGPLRFSEQERALQTAYVSAGWDHYPDVPLFFSNRLPIALASGIPHVTHYHSGYETVLDHSVVRWGQSVNEVIEHIEKLLEQPPETLFDIGTRAREFARVSLAAPVIFQRMFDDICAIRAGADENH